MVVMNTYEVPKISNGPANADTFNTPLNYIQGALNELSGEILSNVNKQAVLQWEVPVASGVNAGDLVYCDTSDSQAFFRKALANTTIDANGKRLRAKSSLVQGLIIAKGSTENSAVLLRYGYFEESSGIIDAVLGVGAVSGLYYLSSSTAGKATKTPSGNLKVPCINYYGKDNGKSKFSVLAVDQGTQILESDSIVRDIVSQTIQVTKGTRGKVTLELKERVKNTDNNSAKAVADFSNSTIYYTDVVCKLVAGPGADVQDLSSSGWRVSSAVQNHYLPAEDVFLNGTQLASDGPYTYILFPGSANGPKAVIQKCLPYYSSSKPFIGNLQVWAYCADGSGDCSVTVKWLPFTGGTEQDLTESDSLSLPMSSGLCLSSTLQNVTLTSQGMLVAVVTSNTTTNIYCNKFGFYLTQASDSGSGN